MFNRIHLTSTALFLIAACGAETGVVSEFEGGVRVHGEMLADGRIQTELSNERGARLALAFDGTSALEITALYSDRVEAFEIDRALVGETIEDWNRLTYDIWLVSPDSDVKTSVSNVASSRLYDVSGANPGESCMTRCLDAPMTTFLQCLNWCVNR